MLCLLNNCSRITDYEIIEIQRNRENLKLAVRHQNISLAAADFLSDRQEDHFAKFISPLRTAKIARAF